MRPWQEIFTDTDREVLRISSLGTKQEFGDRPVLLLIDIKTSCIGHRRQPILETVKEFPISCGEAGWDSAMQTQKLLEACREARIPVVHVTGDAHYRSFTHSSVKGTAPGTISTPEAEEFFPAVAPLPTELVIKKTKASAFFGTPLASCLRDIGTDTLLIGGCTTSGCVRASVVDAYSAGFRCFLVEECVFDRFPLSNLVNLWDINAKYADVISLADALQYVTGVSQPEK